MLQSVSTIHRVVSGLVAAMRSVLDEERFPVYDGVPHEFRDTRGHVVVGIAPGDTVPIVAQEAPAGFGDRSDEDITVRCWLMLQSPIATDHTELREGVVDALSRISDALRADPTLGGACDFCAVSGRVGMYPTRTTDEAVVDVTFEVDAKAYL